MSQNQIIFNGRFLTRQPTGVDRFASEVIAAIDQLICENDPVVRGLTFKILLPKGEAPQRIFNYIPIEFVGWFKGQVWEQVDLAKVRGRNKLILNLCNTGPMLLNNQIVVIHDAAIVRIPATYSLSFKLWYRVLLPVLGLMSRRVLTVSDFSRQDITKCFSIPRRKTFVVTESGEHILRVAPDKSAIARFGLEGKPFALAVSSMAVHKNFRLILKALQHSPQAPYNVAIVGGGNSKVFGKVGDSLPEGVFWLGYVSDAELRALYDSAMCFVFPSLYEGFGLPPLEAMHCGCPVLASRAASIPEVCGDGALYFDPHDAKALAILINKVASDAELRKSLSVRGRKRASLFSWKHAARQIVTACKETMVVS